MKNKIAIFIGRFQPFHNGHLYSLRKALEVGEKVVIGIGSSEESGTENNPWNYEERKKLIEAILEREKLRERVIAIVPIPDFPLDNDWKNYIEKILADLGYQNSQVVAVGNNDWTNRVLKGAGMAVYESGLHNRDELEGVKIREMMRRGDKQWKLRVPEEVAGQINVLTV